MKSLFSELRNTKNPEAVMFSLLSDMLSGYVHESRFIYEDDSAAHTIVRASTNFAAVFGCSVEEYNAAGLWGGQYVHEEEFAALERTRALRRGISVHADVRLTGRDGQSRWLYTKNRPVTDPLTHRVVGVIGVGQDVTHRRLDEKDLRPPLAHDSHEPNAVGNHKIAYTLHHGVAQDLAGAAMLLKASAAQHDFGSLATAIDVLNQTMSDVQGLAADLSPLVAAHDGLASALTLLVEDLRRSNLDVEITIRSPNPATPLKLPFSVENHLYHIAREALYNAIKHSGSKDITLTLQSFRAGVCLTVKDHGIGVAQESVFSSTRGLRHMAQRASVLGAKLSVVGRPAQGTRVVCRLNREKFGIAS